MLKGLKWTIAFFGMIIVFIEILIFVLPPGPSLALSILFQLLFAALGGYALFVLFFLVAGWKHPRWYVKLYTSICFFWQGYWFLGFVSNMVFGRGEVTLMYVTHVTLACGVSALMPIWYWCYKEEKRREEQ